MAIKIFIEGRDEIYVFDPNSIKTIKRFDKNSLKIVFHKNSVDGKRWGQQKNIIFKGEEDRDNAISKLYNDINFEQLLPITIKYPWTPFKPRVVLTPYKNRKLK